MTDVENPFFSRGSIKDRVYSIKIDDLWYICTSSIFIILILILH